MIEARIIIALRISRYIYTFFIYPSSQAYFSLYTSLLSLLKLQLRLQKEPLLKIKPFDPSTPLPYP